jgi:hypothetical protein
MRQFRFVTIRALGNARQAQMIVGATARGTPLGMSTFRIRHLFFLLLFLRADLQIPQGGPALVDYLRFALASAGVPVQPTLRADSFTSFIADLLHRQGQQDILAHYLRELNPASIVKTDLSFPFVDRQLVWSVAVRSRTVEKIEIRVDRAANKLKTTVAIGFDFHVNSAADSNLAERVTKQLRLPFRVKWPYLSQTTEIDLSSRKVLIEPNFSQLEFLYTDKQHTPPPLSTGDENLSIASCDGVTRLFADYETKPIVLGTFVFIVSADRKRFYASA